MWYYVTKIVLTYCEKKCSNDREKLLKFEGEGREFSKFLRSVKQFIPTLKGQNNFWYQNAFLTCSWKFLRSNKVEQLKFQLKKILGFGNMQEKLEKNVPSNK